MGYRVLCFKRDETSGYLDHGKLSRWGLGTWYPHPSAALKAAKNWVSKTPYAYAKVFTHDGALVEEVSG